MFVCMICMRVYVVGAMDSSSREHILVRFIWAFLLASLLGHSIFCFAPKFYIHMQIFKNHSGLNIILVSATISLCNQHRTRLLYIIYKISHTKVEDGNQPDCYRGENQPCRVL